LDVGGYFAPALPDLHGRFTGRIAGVIEDTEHGRRCYADLDKLPCPVISVARSPLKEPEDYLVGQSVVFSTEALLRGRGDILHGRPALVIGFGKLGSSIARLLHAKGVHVTVYDTDPVRRTQALSQGFAVAGERESALTGAGVVLCATGAVSLRGEDFPHLCNGAYVATVTSSDDELDLPGLPDIYTRTMVGAHLTRYQTTGRPGHRPDRAARLGRLGPRTAGARAGPLGAGPGVRRLGRRPASSRSWPGSPSCNPGSTSGTPTLTRSTATSPQPTTSAASWTLAPARSA
jgi:S-adenosylhomocysteine hydrolase